MDRAPATSSDRVLRILLSGDLARVRAEQEALKAGPANRAEGGKEGADDE